MHGDFKPRNKPHNLTVNQGQSERRWKCPSDPRCKTKTRSPREQYEASMEMGRRFADISTAPLTKQDTGDAWNERQNRLAAARDAAKIMLNATMRYNRSKR